MSFQPIPRKRTEADADADAVFAEILADPQSAIIIVRTLDIGQVEVWFGLEKTVIASANDDLVAARLGKMIIARCRAGTRS
jgi:hypothetical protein